MASGDGAAGPGGATAWLLGDEGPVATFLPFGAMISIFLVPFVAMCGGVWAATWAWLDWRVLSRLARTSLCVSAATAGAVAAVHFTSFGHDIALWWIG